ncbi:hypothetical protein [Lysobacter capsici]|uniref:hypothetical protein n=1 Tax=Lysobacter capsici TaxID=435897 RepID=UPI001C0070AB|nr:hypothetical protein [Lysobacter capsici]QWF18701.1 hypothetical protein KME82_08150 [Lysobacter capsici]
MITYSKKPQELLAEIDGQVQKLRHELTTLLARREKVVQLIELSNELGLAVDPKPPLPLPPPLPARPAPLVQFRDDLGNVVPHQSVKASASDRVASYLSDGSREKTAALLKRLDNEGIVIRGKDRVLALSAILSKDERFEASRKLGWALKGALKPSP